MPYEVMTEGEGHYCVRNKRTGKKYGMHGSKAEAEAQMRALYANEPMTGQSKALFYAAEADAEAQLRALYANEPNAREGKALGDILAPIAALNASVSAHWTAIETYTAIARRLKVKLGLTKLADHFQGEADDEREHIARLIDRIEWIGADRTFDHQPPALSGDDVPGMLASSLTLETVASQIERAGVLTCRDAGDEGSALILAANLAGSEESIEWLRAQQRQIAAMGIDNWLADQR